MDNASPSAQIVRFGTFEADLQSGDRRRNGHKVPLQGQPFQVFAILLQHPGKLVNREELRLKLWPEDTFVDLDHGLNTAITKIRTALGDDADNPRFVETMPRRGYRFIGPVDSHSQPELVPVRSTRIQWAMIVALVSVAALATAGYFYFHRAPKLTDKDTIVLADFDNKTGDPVFDSTLRQGLAVQLQQSPFLSLVSDRHIQETLRLMGRPADAKLTPEITRELCQRAGSTAIIDGSIAQIGTRYSLVLKAATCSSGESLTSTEAQASDKSHVLDALGKAASEVRKKLGESLSTVQKYDTPLVQATTSSLEALQAYSLGVKTWSGDGGSAGAVPFLQRAIQLDPNFALAYGALGECYDELGEPSLASETVKKAYELREHASEPEKFYIESHYYENVTGDLEKDHQVCEVWAQTYPRGVGPLGALATIYARLGQYDKFLEQYQEALRRRKSAFLYAELAASYISVNRLEEAQATAKEAQTKNLDSPSLHIVLYMLAFLQNDAAGMDQQVAWAQGKPGVEQGLLAMEEERAAYSGRLKKAREFSRQAAASALGAEVRETAANFDAVAAMREGFLGNATEARQQAAGALRLSTGKGVQDGAALALAMAGDAARAQSLADDLAKRFPEDTIVQFSYLPTLHAQIALTRKD